MTDDEITKIWERHDHTRFNLQSVAIAFARELLNASAQQAEPTKCLICGGKDMHWMGCYSMDDTPAPSASPDEYIKQLEKETSFAKTTLEATREAASGRNKGASPAALTDEPGLLEYVLQDDLHNRTTPRVIDIAYTAFMAAKQPNTEDGGPSDWFTDTRPVVLAAIEKLRKDLLAASPAALLTDEQIDGYWESTLRTDRLAHQKFARAILNAGAVQVRTEGFRDCIDAVMSASKEGA